MNAKKLALVLVILAGVISVSINVLLLIPEEGPSTEEFEVISHDVTTDIEFYIPSGKAGDTVQIIYDDEDITSHCYIKAIDEYHLCVIFDRSIDVNKLSIKC